MSDFTDDLDWYEEDDDSPRREVKCRLCGDTDVYWAEIKDRWVLYGRNSRKHVCKTQINHTDAFDTLD